MNIEQERKAFADWYSDNQDTPLINIWLAAKEHAELMAKQGCFIQHDAAGDWWIVVSNRWSQGTYKTKQAASERALAEGFRIDTPPTEFMDVY